MTPEERLLSELAVAAHELPTADRFRQTVLDRLGTLFPYDSALFLPNAAGDRAQARNKTLWLVDVFRANEQRFARDLERARRIGREQGAYLDTELYTAHERSTLPFFAEIIRPQGITSRLVLTVQFRGRVSASVHLCRHGRAPAYTTDELHAARRLVPTVGLAYSTFESPPPTWSGRFADLGARERQVAERVAAGYQNKEIAALLGLSPNTVRNHLAHVCRKLGVSTRAGVAAAITSARRG